jgi:hypothetical protein
MVVNAALSSAKRKAFGETLRGRKRIDNNYNFIVLH